MRRFRCRQSLESHLQLLISCSFGHSSPIRLRRYRIWAASAFRFRSSTVMVDTVDPATRSRIMAAIRSRDTTPEIKVRKALHARGFRYRIHVATLPGRPDIVFPKYQAVILVHGCFWHGHDCQLFQLPATRSEYWQAKIQRNRERDFSVRRCLSDAGWRHLSIWECALKGSHKREFTDVIDEIAHWLTHRQENTEVKGHPNSDKSARAVGPCGPRINRPLRTLD